MVGAEEGRPRVLWSLFWAAADRSVRVRLIAAVCAAALAATLSVAAPILLKMLLDTLASGETAVSERMGLAWLALLYVGALAAANLAEQAQGYAFGTGEQRLQQRLSAAMFTHVLALPMGFHLDRQAGGLMQTLTLGLDGARIILTHLTFSILPVAIQASLIALVVTQIFDFALWATVAGAIVLYGVVFSVGVRRLSAPTRAVSAAQIEAGGLFADGLVNVEPVKAFAAERHLGSRYQDLLLEGEKRWRLFHARRLENGGATAIVFALTMSAVLLQGVWAYASGRVTIGDFVLLNAYMLQIVQPLEMAGFALRDVAQGANYLEKWGELLRMPREGEASRGFKPSGAAGDGVRVASAIRRAPTIRFEAVSFAYGPDRQILSDVSFTIPAGRSVAVVGPTGAGKSSLVRLLLRYYEPNAGRILFDEAPISAFDLDRLRAMISVVAQDTVLFNDSLERNILFARADAGLHALRRAISQANLEQMLASLPQGLNTIVGERGLKLSGGEKQRVAIARAALRNAPVLILDEATSALDAATERAICSEMIEAAGGRTTLIVTHRLALAAHADEILVLSQGRIVERGQHRDLLAVDGPYARLWHEQDRGADVGKVSSAAE